MNLKEKAILAAVRKASPKKRRVTFFLPEYVKGALADWCLDNKISESGAIEEMIKAAVPERYFKREG